MFPRGGLHDHLLALANPTRLRIVEELAGGESSVNDLAARLRIAQPLISWHLRMLKLGGVVRTRRDGRQTATRSARSKRTSTVCSDSTE
jgi:ArsR family transcriptional regulator